MATLYEYRSETFLIEEQDGGCEYLVKHSEWPEPAWTLYLRPGPSGGVRWGARTSGGGTLDAGGDFRYTVDAVCGNIIESNRKKPTEQERCAEADDFLESLRTNEPG